MRRRAPHFAARILFTAVLFSPTAALAAEVPSRETAGAEESRFREERALDERRAAALDAASPIEEPAAPGAPSEGQKFRVDDVRFSGNYSVPDGELRPYVEKLFGRDVTLEDIRAAVEDVKRHYRSKGYVAAYAYVPPQQLLGGVLKIDVLEGRLGRVSVSGGRWFSAARLERLFRVEPGQVLRYETLRRHLDRVNDLGDVKAKAVLAPGEATGTTDVKIEVEDRAPYHLAADVNNFGTPNTGEFRYGLTGSHTNLFGNLDRLDGNVQLGKGVTAVGGGYSVPLSDTLGSRAGYAYSKASVDVGGQFSVLDVEGEATTHRLFYSQPVLEKQGLKIAATAGFDAKDVENKLLGAVSGKDILRVPNLSVDLRQEDGAGATFVSNRVNWGIADFLGSSDKNDPKASRDGTGGDFFTWRGSATRLQRLPGDVLVSLRGTAQLTPDALAPSEQLSLGGARSVRGYQEGEFLGDHGAYANLDVYVPAWFLPERWRLPNSREPLNKDVQLIAFADVGTATLRRPLAGEKKDRDLAGFGGGFRVRLYDKLYGRFEWAAPVGDRAFDGRDHQFYFTLSYEIF